MKRKKKSRKSRGNAEGVKTLLGEPKKAIIKLAWPMVIAMSVNTIYNLVDALWVSGLGGDELAAVGLFFPFLFLAMALAVGLGTGGGASISRFIGARDKKGADSAGVHTFVWMVIFAVSFAIPFFIFTEPIFTAMGAGEITPLAVSYARVIFAGIIFVFFANVGNAILRSEGDAKKAMYAMMFGAGLNILLDPFFIFGRTNPGPAIFRTIGLDLGVAGAAWATIISMAATSAILAYWLFFRKTTFVSYKFRGFKFNKAINLDIFKVGLPSMVQQASMSITMVALNLIIIGVAGTDGVAIYTVGWRVSMIAILPLLGLATAVISVSGAAFGAKQYEKLDTAYMYTIKLGIMVEALVAALVFFFAGSIAAVFTQAPGAGHLHADITQYFQYTVFFYPGAAAGIFSSSLFQGVGKGVNSLVLTLLRTVFLTITFAYLLAVVFDMGLPGVWLGIVLGNVITSFVSFTWARYYIHGLKKSAEIIPE